VTENSSTKINRFVCFIDDLDRVVPEIAVEILDIVKNIFDLPHCIFVLAVDYEVVIKGLEIKFGQKTKDNEREFRQYFDKIIQIPFTMPIGGYDTHMREFISTCFSQTMGIQSDSGCKDILDNLKTAAMLATDGIPRSVKRIINTMSLLHGIYKNRKRINSDISYKDVEITFIVIALHINFPEICRRVMEKPKFTDWSIADLTELWNLGGVSDDLEKKLEAYGKTFDEEWERVVYCLCQANPWLKAKAVSISNLLNCLRIALGRQDGQKTTTEKLELDAGNVEQLEDIFEDIRVVTVSDDTNPIVTIDTADIKNDTVTVFCRNTHKMLIEKKFKLVDEVSEESYADKPKGYRGDRYYDLTIISKSDLPKFIDTIECYLRWYKKDKKLKIMATFTPSGRNKKKIRDFLDKNQGFTSIEEDVDGGCTCGILLDEHFPKDHFASVSPDVYLGKIDKFYQWLQSALEKLRAV
jgi:hypothetical protein